MVGLVGMEDDEVREESVEAFAKIVGLGFAQLLDVAFLQVVGDCLRVLLSN